MLLEVKRWTRYGKDRVYVSAPDASRVGWLDLVTGAQQLERPAMAKEFIGARPVPHDDGAEWGSSIFGHARLRGSSRTRRVG